MRRKHRAPFARARLAASPHAQSPVRTRSLTFEMAQTSPDASRMLSSETRAAAASAQRATSARVFGERGSETA
jgi:hypothetical protein